MVTFLIMQSAARLWALQAGEPIPEGLCTSSSRIIRNKNTAIFLNRRKTYSANLPIVVGLKSEAVN